MWWKAQTHALARVADRVSTLYVEHATVHRHDNAVVLCEETGEVHVPAALVAALLLGPGTRMTHGAMRLLADSGTTVCWVGENGVRMYAQAVSLAQSSRYLARQAWLVSDPKRRTNVARVMYAMRFPGEDTARLSIQQLRGREGARARTGVPWQGRQYKAGAPFAAGDDVNRLLSAANACLYGICHAAIAGVGASPALGFIHTGSAISFVLDIADLYKAQVSIPVAFDLAVDGVADERAARQRVRDVVVEQGLMERVVRDVRTLLIPADIPVEDPAADDGGESVRAQLWDGEATVESGRNYATDADPSVDW